jgi:MFS family permease
MSRMTKTTAAQTTSNNWLITIFAAITFATNFTIPMSGMPVLFKEISVDLNLDVVQIGIVWGMISLGSILIMPLGGILGDRIGNRRAIVIVGLLSGVAGGLRGVSTGFVSLMATTFLWGLVSAAIIPALNIMASAYAPKHKQGLAQGLVGSGGALGLTLGSILSGALLSPWLGGWRNVLFAYGGVAVLVSLIWWFLVKDPALKADKDPHQALSFRQAFAYLFRLKALWIIGLSMLAYQGCTFGMQGFLPYFLQDSGWTGVAASGALAAYNLAGTLGAIPLTIFSDRIGSRKIPIMLAFITTIICIGLLSILHNWLLWVLVVMAGTFFAMSSALFTTLVIEVKEVGSTYAGTAVGLMLSIAFIGRAVAPPIGNSLAGISATFAWPFIFWAALCVVGAVLLGFIEETAYRKETKDP